MSEDNASYESKSHKDNEDDAIVENENENDLPSEITFEKRTVPKQRTQSIQSVLSSVSLKSLAVQGTGTGSVVHPRKQPFVAPQQSSQPQFINTKTHIQAPAIAASSKRRASFEIGQRLPFNSEEVESDGDVETNDSQKKLTEDALKRLSSFSKFQPAEVDYTIKATSHNDFIHHPEPVPQQHLQLAQDQQQLQLPLKPQQPQLPQLQLPQQQRSYPNSPDVHRVNPNSHLLLRPVSQQSSSSLAKRPSSNPSSAAQERNLKPSKLLSATTSSQNLSNLNSHQSPSITPNPSNGGTPTAKSPDSQHHQQQQQQQASLQTLSDPKRPMYIPAVLRQSPTNLKQEDLEHINEQNSRKAKSVITNAAASLRSQTSHWKLSFEASSTNLPTRAHWRRDITRTTCAFCERPFSFFERRHHCRRCGDIFCAEHTSHLLKLGIDAQFTVGGSGVLCKVCDNCCKDYETFVRNKFGQDSNSSNGKKVNSTMKGDQRKSSVVDNSLTGTVPADWSWSSF